MRGSILKSVQSGSNNNSPGRPINRISFNPKLEDIKIVDKYIDNKNNTKCCIIF